MSAAGPGSPVRTLGVVGCGLMGSGIAQVGAAAGLQTIVCEVDPVVLERGMKRLRGQVERASERGRLEAADATELLARVTPTTQLEDLSGCDLVIEAVTEALEVKRAVFTTLDRCCDESTVFASNTSSLSITEMAMMTGRPDRFVGLHFFNPVPVMALVEVIHTLVTDAEVREGAVAFAGQIGKTAVQVKDRTGFVVNRLLVPYLLEAIRALESGLASAEDIDRAMQLGCGYPMGPFTLLDYVGLDTTLYIAGIMHEEFRQPQYAPPPLLRRLVLAGRLGRKSGRGFYRYDGSGD